MSQTGRKKRSHIAVAVIVDELRRVLISRRPAHVHQGDLWEFPGGKLEPGESVQSALRREVQEELGISVLSARPLIRIHHDYPDRRVLLDVWRVARFAGSPHGREGQPVVWAAPDELADYRFPAANSPIIRATTLPARYLITPSPGKDETEFLAHLARSVDRGISLVQLRVRHLALSRYRILAKQVLSVCQSADARLLLNCDPLLAVELGAHGVHLNSERLMQMRERPLDDQYLVAGSCHSAEQLRHACDIGLDFVVLSPVLETRSHPGAATLGFEGLRALTELANLPVYALGGMREQDLGRAFESGAQGIAAIRGLWG
ncbi:MAG: Nudix family hydrolase [Gammaproteobacteria bacterium]